MKKKKAQEGKIKLAEEKEVEKKEAAEEKEVEKKEAAEEIEVEVKPEVEPEVEPEAQDKQAEEEAEEKTGEEQTPLEKAQAEAAQYYDRWMRLAAEFDNYKRRSARQFAELVQSANERLVTQLLPVLDNFERALNHEGDDETLESFRKGVEMIFGQLHDVLKAEGLKSFDSVGKPFDPNIHDAIMQMESEEHESGTVMEEVQKGYTLGDKVLRHTKVVVSK
ncbi:MAG: nucleotide exchange factor GrpE [Candidatus Latescibacterota bacterium]|nr:MAG: nucleotide exchange factor GrpE [Candidatus Latescibacterota bacterium]